jgi:hypothetical protein
MLREVAAKLGVQIDDKDVVGFMGVLDKAKAGIKGLGTALGVIGFVAFAREQIDAADKLNDTAERLGITTDELERMQYAAKLTGAEIEGVEKSLFIFTKTLGEASKAGGADPFTELKIPIKDASGNLKSMGTILPDVADKIAEMTNESERVATATKFFGKSALAMLPLLKRGREGLQEFNAEFDDLGLGLDQQFIKDAGDFNDQIDRLGFVSKAAGSRLVGALMPALMVIAKWVLKAGAGINWLSKNTTIFKTGVVFLSVALGAKLIPQLLTGIRTLTAMRTVVLGTSLPFLLVAGVIAFLYLLFDDLWVLMKGGKSVIGDLLVQFSGVEGKEAFVKVLKDTWEDLKKVWDACIPIIKAVFSNLDEGQPIVKDLSEAFLTIVKVVLGAVKGVVTLAKVIGALADSGKPGGLAKAGKLIEDAGSDLFGHENSFWNPKTNQMESAYVGGLFGSSKKEWDNQMAAAGVVNTNVSAPITAKVTVTVPPGTAPGAAAAATTEGVAKGVKGALAPAYGATATYVDTSATDSAPGAK